MSAPTAAAAEPAGPPAMSEPPRRSPSPKLAIWLALALVLAVAAFTRLWRLDLIDFKADEAQIAGLALDVAQGRWPATSIPTSNGLDNLPLPVYVFGLAALFTRDPAWQAALIGALDVLAVALTFIAGRRFFGARAGLAAAAFYAANAYAAIFARKLAGPFLEPFFAVLLLLCLLSSVTYPRSTRDRRGPWPWAAAVLLLAVLVQLHLGALLLAPVLVVVLLLDAWRRRSARPVAMAAAGAALAAIAFLPYLVHEASRRPDFLASLRGAAQGTSSWSDGAFRFVWITLTSPGYGDLTGAASRLFNSEGWPAGFVTPITGLAVLGGLAIALWRWRDARYLTLAAFVLLPLLLMLRHGSGLQIHYFVFLEPALFLLAGIGFDALLRAVPGLSIPAFAVLGLLLAVQVAGLRHFTDFLERQALPPDSYGLPLAYQQRLFQQASKLAAGRRVVVAVNGRDQADPAGYFLRGRPNVEVDSAEGLLLPREGGIYAVLSRSTAAAHALDAGLPPSYVERLPGGSTQAAVYELKPETVQGVSTGLSLQPVPPTEWSDGLRLVALAAPRSLPAQLAAAWQVTRPVGASTIIFSQVLDVDGKQWFDRDAVPVEASAWRPGDTLITLTSAALPPGAPRQEYWWSLGVYEEGGRRVALPNGDLQLRLARLKGGETTPTPSGLHALSAVFGGTLRLEGYVLDPGGVTLQWDCVAPVDKDYTVFVHALDNSGKLVGQSDAQPARYPTSLWDAGERVVDRHTLPVPAQASSLEVGVYELSSGARLKLAGGSDHVTLPLQAGG
jgi:4-amino-4-deoxy-L-arabinose transferase-like glycosyltransferase